MEKQISIIALVLIGILACSKKDSTSPDNNNANPIATSGCLVADVTDSASNQKEESYTYDANRRLIKYTYDKKGSYSTFTYGTGTVTVQNFSSSGIASRSPKTISLNANGYYKGDIYSVPDTPSTPGVRKDTIVLTYTSDNRLLSFKYNYTTYANNFNSIIDQMSRTSNYTYSGNKLTKLVVGVYNGVGGKSNESYTHEYTYDETSPTVKSANPVFSEDGSGNGYFYGRIKSDKIPEKKVTTRSSSGSPIPSVYTTTYTAVVDAKGNPTKVRTVTTYSDGTSPFIRTKYYTYNCP